MNLLPLFFLCIVGILSFFAGNARGAGFGKKDEARQFISEWIQNERIISEEESAWIEERAIMGSLIDLMRVDSEKLKSFLGEDEDLRSSAEARRLEMQEDLDRLKGKERSLAVKIGNFERVILKLELELPLSLKKELALFFDNVRRAQGEGVTLPLGQRVRNLIFILDKVGQFNSAITLVDEKQTRPDGKGVAVKVLHFGLGNAYFTDSQGELAGILVPGQGGWKTIFRPELSGSIQEAIRIHENQHLAELVDLPVTLKP